MKKEKVVKERQEKESWKLTWVESVKSGTVTPAPTRQNAQTTKHSSSSVLPYPFIQLYMEQHSVIFVICSWPCIQWHSYQPQTSHKQWSKKYGRRLTQCRSLWSLFRFFPGTTRLAAPLLYLFFLSQRNLQDCTTWPLLSLTSAFQCTRLFWSFWTSCRCVANIVASIGGSWFRRSLRWTKWSHQCRTMR